MQYLGGKTRLAPQLAAAMLRCMVPGQRFVDAFCGGLSVTVAIGGGRPRLANDGCTPLITLYRAWLAGWRPPEPVTEDSYRELREAQDPTNPLTAFAGFGLSYAGKWYGGFARNRRGYDYHAGAVRSLDRVLARCEGVAFTCCDFRELDVRPGDLVYADPPYRGTTAYGFFREAFPYEEFARAVLWWKALGASVFVSEYTPPTPGAVLVWEAPTHATQLATGAHTEKLYLV